MTRRTGAGDSVRTLTGLGKLQPFPGNAIRLIQAATDEMAEIDELARLIRQDAGLVTTVLRHANSVSRGRLVEANASLDEAVMSLGLRGITEICVTQLCDRYLIGPVENQEAALALWDFSLAVSAVARRIAPRFGANPGLASTAGLLSEIGHLGLLRSDPLIFSALHGAVLDGEPISDADERLLGMSALALSAHAAGIMGLTPVLHELLARLARGHASGAPEVEAVLVARSLVPMLGYPEFPDAPAKAPGARATPFLDGDPAEARELARIAVQAIRSLSPRSQSDLGSTNEEAFDAVLRVNRVLARVNQEYVRTREEVKLNAAEMRNLADTFAAMTMGLDVEALQYSILESLLDKYQVDATFMVSSTDGLGQMDGALFKITEDGIPEFEPLTISLSDMDRPSREPLTKGMAITLETPDQCRRLREATNEPEFMRIAPLMIRGNCNGMLGIAHFRTDGNLQTRGEFLSILAGAVALALDNARLYEKTLAEATVDPLTGVATRRVLMDELDTLVRTGAGSPVGVLIIDLDHFKSVNDTLGHQAGDRYLKDVSRAIETRLAARDLLARYGGDEFVVVSLGRAAGDLLALAETLRVAVEDVAKGERWVTIPQPLGATFGVALYEDAHSDAAQIIAQADASLYEAKEAGRNRVGRLLSTEPLVT